MSRPVQLPKRRFLYPVQVDLGRIEMTEAASLLASIRGRRLLLYPVAHPLASDRGPPPVIWDGPDAGEFLDFAQKVGARMIYAYELRVASSSRAARSTRSHRTPETGYIELAFVRDGVRHVFEWRASWAKNLTVPRASSGYSGVYSPPRLPNPAEVRTLASELKGRETELVDSFLRSFRAGKDPLPNPDSEWQVRGAFLSYLGDLLELSSLKPEREGPGNLFSQPVPLGNARAERSLRVASLLITKRIRVTDSKKAKHLAEGCAKWALDAGIPLRSFNLDRVREFLDNVGSTLTEPGLRDLRDKATAIVKAKTHYVSHHKKH